MADAGFRGLDNTTYYILEQDRSRYANYSGTGNTLNANHPIVRRMIVTASGIGWRRCTSTASASTRVDPGARPVGPGDPQSAGAVGHRVGARAGGDEAHRRSVGCGRPVQVGTFAGDSWKEWNGRFRDDVRSFFRGEEGSINALSTA